MAVVSFGNIGTDLHYKSGIESGPSFSGTPKIKAVVFATPFETSNYSITLEGDQDSRAWTYESKTASGFTINSNAGAALSGEVSWHAILVGETL